MLNFVGITATTHGTVYLYLIFDMYRYKKKPILLGGSVPH